MFAVNYLEIQNFYNLDDGSTYMKIITLDVIFSIMGNKTFKVTLYPPG